MRNKRKEESEYTGIEYLQSCSSFLLSQVSDKYPEKKNGGKKEKKGRLECSATLSSTRKLLLKDESISLLKAHGEEGITFDITSKFIYY